MDSSYSVGQIAQWVNGEVRGDADARVCTVAGMREAGPDQITWLADRKYLKDLPNCRAGVVLVDRSVDDAPIPTIVCDRPELAIITVLEKLAPPTPRPTPGIDPTARVAESAQIGNEVAIGPHAIIGERARIGERCVIHAGVHIGDDTVLGEDCEIWNHVVIRERCTLGRHVVIHPHCTIGADGFGYVYANGQHNKIPQIGTVIIEDEVEIGANCCIDRGKFGPTRIGAGTKIDNLVQVAHNVSIGPGCILVAQCALGGSAQLGQGVVLGGKVAIRDHVTVHDGAMVAGCSCVGADVEAGQRVMGIPAVDFQQHQRGQARVYRLAQFFEQVRALAKRVDQLETAANDRPTG